MQDRAPQDDTETLNPEAALLGHRNARHPGVALVLQGGGARAAYQVGVLKALSEILGHPKDNPFPIITGTSAGAINSAVLAAHADNFAAGVEKLVQVWSNFSPEQVYRTDLYGVLRNSSKWLTSFFFGAFRRNRKVSLFDNAPLLDLIAKHIPLKRIPEHLASGVLRAVSVVASGYGSGQNCAFFQAHQEVKGWRRSQRVGVRVSQLRPEHLMASAAIPFAFPATKINREYFGDGSIRQTAPLSPALHLGASRVFVVGTAKLVKIEEERLHDSAYPSLAQIAGHAMASIFLDALAVDIERMKRINRTLALLPDSALADTPLRPLEALVISPSQRVDDIASRHLQTLPAPVRTLLRGVGVSGKGDEARGTALASYLLFEAPFTQELMALGEADTVARRDEVMRFFDWDTMPGRKRANPSDPDVLLP